MLLVAVRAGLGFAVILSILGMVQSQPLSDMLVAFTAAGIVPGTDLQVPPDLALIAAAAALVIIIVLLFRGHFALQGKIEAAVQEYGHFGEDPAFEVLVPGLKRLASLRRSAQVRSMDFLVALLFWARSLGRPIVAQAIAARRGVAGSLIRFDSQAFMRFYWSEIPATVGNHVRRFLEFSAVLRRQTVEKARHAFRAVYLLLATML